MDPNAKRGLISRELLLQFMDQILDFFFFFDRSSIYDLDRSFKAFLLFTDTTIEPW